MNACEMSGCAKLGLQVFGRVGEVGRDDGVLGHRGGCYTQPNRVGYYAPENTSSTYERR